MTSELIEFCPTLMSGEYRYNQTISTEDNPNFDTNQSQNLIEIHGSDGNRYITTSDGYQYMIVENTEISTEESIEKTDIQSMDTMIAVEYNTTEEPMSVSPKTEPKPTENNDLNENDFHKCVEKVMDLLSENKENIDPNVEPKQRQKRKYRKRQKKDKSIESAIDSLSANNDSDVVMRSLSTTSGQKKRKPRKLKTKKF